MKKSKIFIIALMLLPFWAIAQSDSTSIEPLTDKEKLTLMNKGNTYFIDVNEFLEGSSSTKLPSSTVDLLKNISTFCKENKKKVRLIYITNLTKNEYERFTPEDANRTFLIIRKTLGARTSISSTEIRFENPDVFGVIKIMIE